MSGRGDTAEGPVFARRTIPLWADLVLVVISLCCATHRMQDMADSLSFGGFFVLFVMAVLGVWYSALLGSLILLPLSIRSGKVRYAAIAAALRIPSPIPWLWLIHAFGYPSSWFEILMIASSAAAVLLLISLPAVKLASRAPH